MRFGPGLNSRSRADYGLQVLFLKRLPPIGKGQTLFVAHSAPAGSLMLISSVCLARQELQEQQAAASKHQKAVQQLGAEAAHKHLHLRIAQGAWSLCTHRDAVCQQSRLGSAQCT